jgi:hypothetical protein
MQSRGKIAAMLASRAEAKERKPAQTTDEDIKASIEAAEGDFKETEEEKKTISYREIDPDMEKKWLEHMARVKAIQGRKVRDKKAYDRFQQELTKQEKGW